ncbi:hypothetical protein LCGC14_1926250, partial [marine sediment metagenome]
QLAKEGKKLEDIGVYFDPTKPLDFYNVMGQLHDRYTEQGRSLDFLNELVGIFGVRGIRAVGSVLELWEKFNEEVKRTPESLEEAAKIMKESAENTISSILSRAWHNIITSRDIPSGKSGFKDAFKKIFMFDEVEKGDLKIKVVTEALHKYGKELGLTAVQVKSLSTELGLLGAPNLADELAKTFGVSLLSVILASTAALEEGADGFEAITAKVSELEQAEKSLETQHAKIREQFFGGRPIEGADKELLALKEGLKYRTLALQKVSQTSIIMSKIVDFLDEKNKMAEQLGKEYITIGDVLSLNKDKIKTITQYYKELLNLGVKVIASAEKDRLQIQQSLIKSQLDQLKVQGATLQQLNRAKTLFEDSLGNQRNINEATNRELDLRKAINAQKEIDVNLSSQTLKLAEIANTRGIEVARELGDLLQGRVKFAEFERDAMDETWDALVKNFPNIIKQQRALQLLIQGVDPTGRVVSGAREIPIKEEALRKPEILMVSELKLQMAIKERELQKQIEVLEKQQQIKEELIKQTILLKTIGEINRANVSPGVKIYFKDKPVSKDDFVVEIKTDGSTIANALDDRIEK